MEPRQTDLTAIDEFLKEYPDSENGAAHNVLVDYHIDDISIKHALEDLVTDKAELDLTKKFLESENVKDTEATELFLTQYPNAKYGPAEYVFEGHTNLFSIEFAFDEIERKHEEYDATILFLKNFRFWSCQQRTSHSLQEISYRACFRPQLPAYFIKAYCAEDSVVYDPFMGRGTTLIEAQLHGCQAIGNDSNPLSKILVAPRLNPPDLYDVRDRISAYNFSDKTEIDDERLLTFFHIDTLKEIYDWRNYFWAKRLAGEFDAVDDWIRMIICNRLTGHSSGFFSVYTLPPNQTASVKSQFRINAKYKQHPTYRDTKALIYKKTKQLLEDDIPCHYRRNDAVLSTASADNTPRIADESVDLVVTSPPFLNTVNYVQDNWMRLWFCDIDVDTSIIWHTGKLDKWTANIADVLVELERIVKLGGRIAFEVGEIRNKTIMLEDSVVKAVGNTGLSVEKVIINDEQFTKTSNIWGIDNNKKGTNSNRIVVLRKDNQCLKYC